MTLTSQQNIPEKPKASEPWTLKRLFPFSAMLTPLAKTFVNPLDVLLGYLVLIVGLAELLGRNISWFFWVFIILILTADIYERHFVSPAETKPIIKDGK